VFSPKGLCLLILPLVVLKKREGFKGKREGFKGKKGRIKRKP
jgi:hypothetical protein